MHDPTFWEFMLNSEYPDFREVARLKIAGDVWGLLPFLGDAEPNVRNRAASALGAIQEPQSVDVLLTALQNPDRDVRDAAVTGLQWHADPRVVAPLLGMLKEPDVELRRWIPGLLEKFVTAEVVDALIQTLQDTREDSGVRRRSFIALGKMRDPRSLEPLVAAIRDPDPEIRDIVRHYLFDDPRVGDLVAPLLDDSDPAVRRIAAHILGQISDPRALDGLIDACREHDDWLALHLLAKYTDPRIPMLVLASLRSDTADVRQTATDLLPSIFGSAALRLLRVMATDPAPLVRAAAIQALAELGDRAAIGDILPLLRDADRWVREKAVEAVGAFKAAKALDPLMALLADDPEWSVRASAAEALGRLGDPRAIGVLTQALRDDGGSGNDYEVRDKAREALALLGVIVAEP